MKKVSAVIFSVVVAVGAMNGYSDEVASADEHGPTRPDWESIKANAMPHVALPDESLKTSATWQPTFTSQLPVAIAVGITVLCVPFFPSTGQANPTQVRLRMHAGRPL